MTNIEIYLKPFWEVACPVKGNRHEKRSCWKKWQNWDVNISYGTSVRQNLPKRIFFEIEVTYTKKGLLLNLSWSKRVDFGLGYLNESDLEYSPKRHGKTKNFPLFPVKLDNKFFAIFFDGK